MPADTHHRLLRLIEPAVIPAIWRGHETRLCHKEPAVIIIRHHVPPNPEALRQHHYHMAKPSERPGCPSKPCQDLKRRFSHPLIHFALGEDSITPCQRHGASRPVPPPKAPTQNLRNPLQTPRHPANRRNTSSLRKSNTFKFAAVFDHFQSVLITNDSPSAALSLFTHGSPGKFPIAVLIPSSKPAKVPIPGRLCGASV